MKGVRGGRGDADGDTVGDTVVAGVKVDGEGDCGDDGCGDCVGGGACDGGTCIATVDEVALSLGEPIVPATAIACTL